MADSGNKMKDKPKKSEQKSESDSTVWSGDLPQLEVPENEMPDLPELPEVKVPVKWSGKSKVNFQLTLFIASVWVLTLGSAPIVIYKFADKKVTRSAMMLSGLMWTALFGGLYVFTNIVYFNSPHFDRVRSLTIIECTYFMTQVITTVGYGDITPAFRRGQVFVGIYVTLSFFVIALLMAEMQIIVMDKVNEYKERLRAKLKESARDRGHGIHPSQEESNATSGLSFKPEKPSFVNLVISLGAFFAIAFVWVMFFHFYPGEEKTFLQAVYMSLITLTTVGFGAITPDTEEGMLFGAFFMFIGTTALLNVVQNFSTYILEMDEYEGWCPKEFESGLKKFREKYAAESDQSLTEEKFVVLALLQKKRVTEDEIDQIKDSYKKMSGAKGKLNLKGFASNVCSEIDRADLGDSATEAGSLPHSARSD